MTFKTFMAKADGLKLLLRKFKDDHNIVLNIVSNCDFELIDVYYYIPKLDEVYKVTYGFNGLGYLYVEGSAKPIIELSDEVMLFNEYDNYHWKDEDEASKILIKNPANYNWEEEEEEEDDYD